MYFKNKWKSHKINWIILINQLNKYCVFVLIHGLYGLWPLALPDSKEYDFILSYFTIDRFIQKNKCPDYETWFSFLFK